jgi:LacI family transcriptional regulator
MSLIGFDAIPQAKMVYPPLTTVHHLLYAIGQMAVRILPAQIENAGLPPQHISLSTSLEFRESCLPPLRL